MSDIVIIPYTEDARPFVYDSFVRSWCDAAREGSDLAQLLFRADPARPVLALHRYLDLVLARASTYLAVAEKNTSAYIAWMAASGDCLEFCYTKRDARRLGIARDLMKHHGRLLTRQALVTWPWTARLTQGENVNSALRALGKDPR